jgi:serine/threonine protein kinase
MSFYSVYSAVLPSFHEVLDCEYQLAQNTKKCLPIFNDVLIEWMESMDQLIKKIQYVFQDKIGKTENIYKEIIGLKPQLDQRFESFFISIDHSLDQKPILNYYIVNRIQEMKNWIFSHQWVGEFSVGTQEYFFKAKMEKYLKALLGCQRALFIMEDLLKNSQKKFNCALSFLKMSIEPIGFKDECNKIHFYWLRSISPETYWCARSLLNGHEWQFITKKTCSGSQGKISIVHLGPKHFIRKKIKNTDSYFHELKALTILNGCPHVVSVISHDHDQKMILEECADFGNLDDWIQSIQKQSGHYEFMYRAFFQLCLGLQEIHFLNIMHGDLKVTNFVVASLNQKDFFIKICDFGFSREFYQEEAICGTLNTAPPEMLLAAIDQYTNFSVSANPKIDVYSMGIMIYAFLSNNINLLICPSNADGTVDKDGFAQRFEVMKKFYDADGEIKYNNKLLIKSSYDYNLLHKTMSVDPDRRPIVYEMLQKIFPKYWVCFAQKNPEWLKTFLPDPNHIIME